MAGSVGNDSPPGELTIRPARLEDLADIRYLHTSSFKALAAQMLPLEDTEAVLRHMRTPDYADKVMADALFAAVIGTELVATAGWAPPNSGTTWARLRSVFVNPLFAGLGIGRRIVLAAEADARQAGYDSYSARSTVNAVGFFEHLDYRITSQGVRSFDGVRTVPVFFMRKSLADIPTADRNPSKAS